MGYAAAVAAVYIIWFQPGFFSRPLLAMPLLGISALVLIAMRRSALPTLLAMLLLSASIDSLSFSSVDIAMAEERVEVLYGRVIQDSQQKSGRSSGFRLALYGAADGHGAYSSASGCIHIVSSVSDLRYGDEAAVHGRLSGPIFISSSAELLSRPRLGSIRSHATAWIKDRLLPLGDAGELASLLILGTGSFGGFSLQDDARSAGLAHVLALSGMHLSIIAAVVSQPSAIMLGRRGGKAFLYAVLVLFSFLSGWRPSLVRALIFRILIEAGLKLEEAFLISLPLLLMILPESSADLGAVYSFISLGGIFILSGPLDRAVRTFLPLPYAISISMSASAAALIAAAPMTLSVFGSFQLGAVVSSFPFNALISIYMVLSIICLIIPPAGRLLGMLYRLLEEGFSIAGSMEEADSIIVYLAFVLAAFSILALAEIVQRRERAPQREP